jgi:transposase-like protein
MSTKSDESAPHAATEKTFSEQEKRDYYKAWESSGMHKSRFCKEHGLPVDAFYCWHKMFRKRSLSAESKQFSPVIIKHTSPNLQQNMTQLELQLPNQTKLLITLRENQLVSFIQELCHAVTIIR